MTNDEIKQAWFVTKLVTTIVVIVFGLIILGMWGCPRYSVYQQNLQGKAELARASQNRQIKIQESMAKFEAAVYDKQADSTRAVGVAISNHIIGSSLKGNYEYLQWLWITETATKDVDKEVIYVPTEAKIPIMEAGRITKTPIVNVEVTKDESK